jgi:hypothetical protein
MAVLIGLLLLGAFTQRFWISISDILWGWVPIVMGIGASLSALLLRLGTLKVGGIWGETPLGTLLIGLGVVGMGILWRYEHTVVMVVSVVMFGVGLKIEASARKARVQF